jgi:hypothetical protein
MRRAIFETHGVALAAFVALVTMLACTPDRPADTPTDVALVVPPVSDAGPTIRASEQSDYLRLPSAAPPTASAVPVDDDGIEIPECREVVAWMRRCMGETAARDVARNLRSATQSSDPQVRGAIAEACKRMAEAYAQNGSCGGP